MKRKREKGPNENPDPDPRIDIQKRGHTRVFPNDMTMTVIDTGGEIDIVKMIAVDINIRDPDFIL